MPVHNDSAAAPHTDSAAAPHTYLHGSTAPLASLAFIAPLLLCYEAGVVALGPEAMRNGADVWLRYLLDGIGFGQYFLLPLLTCGVLIAWHHMARHPWRVSRRVWCGMAGESLAFSFFLLALAQLHAAVLSPVDLKPRMTHAASSAVASNVYTAAPAGVEKLGVIVGYCGAGIYEELLFRLLMLPALAGLFQWWGVRRLESLVAAVLLTSLIFAAAHYKVELSFAGAHFTSHFGEPFAWFSFAFRFSAGVCFALLFWYRGFGVAVGAHVLYDVWTAVLR